ncbi:MAG: pseudouridine synthase [Eubacteriales bacterium]|nr:rRNA pseudouridine synthase [Christensenellaceae bacterium]MDD7245412.1 pseudouridine synthase [Christensenellaceae bacterium]MDY2751033.1 pseudouridine synthase [Eubacteriales bacterium]MDY4709375.1 pseudouridine synthase [Eubacteriales bacterium]MDY6079080.1 pseudouridine synthase [Eubacteriales bacterium]
MRINKYIASSGVTSRRNADKLVTEGRVKVNGKTVTELGFDVNENNDTVSVDGKKIALINKYTYIMMYKPKGCVCSANDECGRKTVFDYVDVDKRLFTVGRLDYDSEGLLLLTNDGALAQYITHPGNEIPKSYLVKVEGDIPEADLARLRKGVKLDDGSLTARAKVRLKEIAGNVYSYDVTIFEGKNREIRRMFEAIGKEVIFLKRVAVGDLRLGGLSRGTYRYLTDKEIDYLKNL